MRHLLTKPAMALSRKLPRSSIMSSPKGVLSAGIDADRFAKIASRSARRKRTDIVICFDSNDRFVQVLSADLAPVRRLAPPSRRLMTWLAIVGLAALALAMVSDDRSMIDRLMAAPDMWLAAAGSLLTAVSAAAAAFQLSLPDRKPAWALLPIPPALLWIGASGIGCLRPRFIAGTSPMSIGDSDNCLVFILSFSLPLSLLLIVMLRQGFSLRPNLTAVVGGLTCASAAATLLNFVHPYDATASDLAVHAAAVGIVVLANALFGSRILTSEISSTAIT